MGRESYMRPETEVLDVSVGLGFAASVEERSKVSTGRTGMNRFTWIVAAYCVLLSGCADDGLQDVLPSRTVTRNVRIAACVRRRAPNWRRTGIMCFGRRATVSASMSRAATRLLRRMSPWPSKEGSGFRRFFQRRHYPCGRGVGVHALCLLSYSEQTSADATGVGFTLASQQVQAATGDSSHLGITTSWSPMP